MLRARAVATCAALGTALALSSVSLRAAAQVGDTAQPVQPRSGLAERVRILQGYTNEKRGDVVSQDFWLGVAPELTFYVVGRRWLFHTTYGLTLASHTLRANELANRLSLGTQAELTPRTTLLLSAEANQSSVSNYLLTRPAADTPVAAAPAANTQLLSVAGSEGLSWEASPVVRLGQSIEGIYVTSLDEATRLHNYFVNASAFGDRSWKVDSVGLEAHGAFADSKPAAPAIEQKLIIVSLAPRWRHDISRSFSSSVAAGPSLIFSPDKKTKPAVGAFGRASLLYSWDTARAELTYAHGYDPNILTGQVLRSDSVALHGALPLSEQYRVVGSASVGYLHAKNVVLRSDAVEGDEFNAVLSDVEVGWSPLAFLQVFGRYQFLGQTSGATNPLDTALVRHAFVIGLQLSSGGPSGVASAVERFPQRVDRGDAPK